MFRERVSLNLVLQAILMLIFMILDNLFLMLISDNLCDHLRDVPWVGIFKLGASASASEF